MQYLVHMTLSGEPVGIFAENGDDYYFPAFEDTLGKQGRSAVSHRGENVPWDAFVDQKTRAFNHRYLWDAVEDERNDLEDVLMDLRSKYQSH